MDTIPAKVIANCGHEDDPITVPLEHGGGYLTPSLCKSCQELQQVVGINDLNSSQLIRLNRLGNVLTKAS